MQCNPYKLRLSGFHIQFFSESSARQVSLMAYLLGYNLGCPDKSAELYKKSGKKIVCNMNTCDKQFISVIVTTKGF